MISCHEDGTWFVAVPECDLIARMINWREVLGNVTLDDILRQVQVENEKDGPYSWDTACKIGMVANVKSDLETSAAKVAFEKWFNERFACWIKKEKLQGMKRPQTHKGFWASLFGS